MPKPVINIRGNKRIKIRKGDQYDDPGADHDRGSFKQTGEVDVNKMGVYLIRYQAENSSGVTTEEREVFVTEEGKTGMTLGNFRGSMRTFR